MVSILPDASTEAASARDGLFSYSREGHAFLIGITTGLTSHPDTPPLVRSLVGVATLSPKALADVRAEPWYCLGGLLAGRFLTHIRD